MNRKKFVSNLAFAGMGISSFGVTAFNSQLKKSIPLSDSGNPFFKLSLAQWSLNIMIKNGDISPYMFAELAKKWGFEGLEYVISLYKDVSDASSSNFAINQFVKRNNQLANQYDLKNLLIMIDDIGDLSTKNKTSRLKAIENHKPWVEAASQMDCHSIRVNLHGIADDIESWKTVSKESLSTLSDFASNYNINIIVENHGGFSSDADLLMDVINDVNKVNCGTLPDFGNFCISKKWGASNQDCDKEYDRYLGVKKLMSKAFAVSAKSYDFDSNGNENTIDYKKMMNIVKQAGYSGYIGVEYEGTDLSQELGTIATRDLLLKHG
tara:strand:- start:965 stop:1933 length:969 start_codon:yes stop_codon:yes gene_type:complete